MNTSDFDYDLPPSFIAQTPVEPRDSARLLVLDRRTGALRHAIFRDLGKFLEPGDLLVLNETRVIPARLFARKIPSGGRVELLLLHKVEGETWEALVGGKGLAAGKRLQVESGPQAEILAVLDGPRRLVLFEQPVEPTLAQSGHVPLPPYIHAPLPDPERYQTVYARQPGSAAAPTAGLHFTPGLIDSLRAQGIRFAALTLHVGLDTFAPVTEDHAEEHVIHTEWCQITPVAAQAINEARRSGRRIIAVGTTSVRTLESAARRPEAAKRAEAARNAEAPRIAEPAGRAEATGRADVTASPEARIVGPFEGPTDLFILPGYSFRAVDAMITNFHLPRSTLIMLVSAFAGRERILAAYEEAKRENYRFYSFGDAMLIL